MVINMNLQKVNKTIEEIIKEMNLEIKHANNSKILGNYRKIIEFLKEIQLSQNYKDGKITVELITAIYNYIIGAGEYQEYDIDSFLATIKVIITSKYYRKIMINEYVIMNNLKSCNFEYAECEIISEVFQLIEMNFFYKTRIDLRRYRNKIFEEHHIKDEEKMLFTSDWLLKVRNIFLFYLSDNFYNVSDVFFNGLIGEKELRWLIKLNAITDASKRLYFCEKILNIFKSENYSRGLIKEEQLTKLYDIVFCENDSYVGDSYKIMVDTLCNRLAMGLIGEKELGWLIRLNVIIDASKRQYFREKFLNIFKSKNYSRGLIKEEHLTKLYDIAFYEEDLYGVDSYKIKAENVANYLAYSPIETFENSKLIMQELNLMCTDNMLIWYLGKFAQSFKRRK